MKTNRTGCDLKSCIFCTTRQEGWLPVLDFNRKTLSFKKGELIFTEGSPVNGVYFMYEGIVKIHQQWSNQKQLILNFARRGEMIGYRGLGTDPTFPVTATALEAVSVCYIELPFFEVSLEANHKLTYRLMKFFANELQEAERRMRNLALMDVKGRVAETVLMLLRKFGTDKNGFIDVVLTRQDMAAYAGTTYETFFRMVNELKTAQLIGQAGKKIAILNQDGLQDLVQLTN